MEHTPTPWRAYRWTNHAPRTVLVDDPARLTGKRVVAECERDEDAAFIVTACNAHDQLVAALKAMTALYEMHAIDGHQAMKKIGWDGTGTSAEFAHRLRDGALAAAGAA